MSTREPLSNVDTAWLRMDHPTNLMMITGVMMFDAPLDMERLKAVLTERLLSYDRFRQCVVDREGDPHWVEDPYFDLDQHLHRVALPAPGDQQALQDFVSDLMSHPLDPDRPLWDMYVVENYGDGCALIPRIHHCIADGMALVRVLLDLTDDRPTRRASARSGVTAATASGSASLLGGLAGFVRGTARLARAAVDESLSLLFNPRHLLHRARQGLDLASVVAKLLLQGPDTRTILKGPLGVKKRAAWSQPIPLAEVKRIGKAMGGTINDVLVATAAGALRRYLIAHDQPVDGIEVRAVVPVNLRPPDAPPTLGNRFGLVFLPLPVGLPDPVERLREVHRRMTRIKDSSEAVLLFGLLQGVGMAPGEIQRLIVKLFSHMGTAVMTNVPGPRHQLYLAGVPLRKIMFWVPRSGAVGLGVSILSYNGEVLVGFASDAGLIPDPNELTAAFHAEFEDLQTRFPA